MSYDGSVSRLVYHRTKIRFWWQAFRLTKWPLRICIGTGLLALALGLCWMWVVVAHMHLSEQTNLELVKLVVTTLATLAAAGSVAYFANQQAKTAKAKVKFDLFEERYAIYKKVFHALEMINKPVNSPLAFATMAATPDRESIESRLDLREETFKAQFLFDQEVSAFVGEVQSHIRNLRWQEHFPIGTQPTPAFEKAAMQARMWLAANAYGKSRGVFMPYLDFRNLK